MAWGLSYLISKVERQGIIHGLKVCRGPPSFSHLFFTDDSFLFFRASPSECAAIKHILSLYEVASGQAINFAKSGIFYSKNVDQFNRDILSDLLGVSEPLNTDKYLGLPSLIGSKKNVFFHYLRDKLWSRIQS